ncbi:hypothetical protein SAMN05216420_101361 [Nitrosospira sp. Nl5]|nr:hypothetical protein SAMN05216420_101361 [Nitrosospira sp. Nl5]
MFTTIDTIIAFWIVLSPLFSLLAGMFIAAGDVEIVEQS